MNLPADVDLACHSVSKAFGRGSSITKVIEDLSFSVRRGETYCLLGPSGCGKTTLLRILLGLEAADSGEVAINKERRSTGMAYVQQRPALLPWRTVLQNAILGVEIRRSLNETTEGRIRREIERYGLAGLENRLAGGLSGGEAQRVELVRALGSRPAILLCDEPFSAIDFVTRLSLSTRFKQMCKEFMVTTVFVTHNIEEAIYLGDRVGVLSRGPARLLAEYNPQLSIGGEDAVKCRESPEFIEYFEKIWGDLKRSHAVLPECDEQSEQECSPGS